ncbi:protein tyrosine phosphatase [Pseudomonas sp. Bc-h]|jgi:protein tyrosine/serine phosphatase|uniref:phosphatase domain-containing protein n=1 Tax=Pseudomonas sp. Bc-h TaxID=1943632 RepID=UPI0009DAE74F|nr:dual specificity protein phosphatase family protein [Pseudomonas sp. Bc-h]OQR35469.1 protein tyrosine phosphatase [Pseudomonas sp. Bc-h]
MRTQLILPLAAFLCSFAQAGEYSVSSPRPSQWAQPIDTHYNLYEMTPTLYRSRQPDAAAQPLLKKLGVVTVVDFIKESDSKWLSDPSVAQVQIPLQTVHVDDADMIQSLRAIRTAQEKGPVLIHCKHGLDRTGLVAAMYRIVVQGWSKQAALDEMEHGGFGDADDLKHGIDYINKVDVDALKTALDSGACSTSAFASCAIKGWFQKTDVVGVQTILWRL